MIGQSWAKDEFANLDMGDQRLNSRFINICDRFSESPESPINQACNDYYCLEIVYDDVDRKD